MAPPDWNKKCPCTFHQLGRCFEDVRTVHKLSAWTSHYIRVRKQQCFGDLTGQRQITEPKVSSCHGVGYVLTQPYIISCVLISLFGCKYEVISHELEAGCFTLGCGPVSMNKIPRLLHSQAVWMSVTTISQMASALRHPQASQHVSVLSFPQLHSTHHH